MIFDASDFERRRIHVLASACKVGMHLRTESFVLQERDSVLCGPDEMEVDLSKRLRHRSSPELYNPVGVGDRGDATTQGGALRADPGLCHTIPSGLGSFVAFFDHLSRATLSCTTTELSGQNAREADVLVRLKRLDTN